jgi:hypothetical protein
MYDQDSTTVTGADQQSIGGHGRTRGCSLPCGTRRDVRVSVSLPRACSPELPPPPVGGCTVAAHHLTVLPDRTAPHRTAPSDPIGIGNRLLILGARYPLIFPSFPTKSEAATCLGMAASNKPAWARPDPYRPRPLEDTRARGTEAITFSGASRLGHVRTRSPSRAGSYTEACPCADAVSVFRLLKQPIYSEYARMHA